MQNGHGFFSFGDGRFLGGADPGSPALGLELVLINLAHEGLAMLMLTRHREDILDTGPCTLRGARLMRHLWHLTEF